MKELKLTKPNGHIVPVLEIVPEGAKGIVIMVHGFTSSKSCATAELLFRRMTEVGIGVVTYDQPGHGTEEAFCDALRVENCIDSLQVVERYVADKYPDAEIYYFSSSFGAYITGLYISTREHKGKKAFFRSAAVNMPDLILKPLEAAWCDEIKQLLDTAGYIEPDLGLGETVKLTTGFLKDLSENNLFEIFDNDKFSHTDVEHIHGSEDQVVALNAAQSFAEKFGFPMTIIDGENHSICAKAESPDIVADAAIEFYNSK